ncbi:MAG TPA: D-amino acid aminotransferase [Casimicrobiaceae bacterium]|nr:D-amino acid aminotransferase [Casimicrobiaceae bacterium]
MIDADRVVYLNGEFLPLGNAKISVLDRGFIYGDGVYEVVPVYGRKPFRMPQHLARLAHSLEGIRLADPLHDRWTMLIGDLIARQPFDDQAVYLQITRGVAKRDHAFPQGVTPTVFMMSNPLALPTREQVEHGVAVITAEDNRWLRCDLKTTSLVGNVLMRQLAADHDAIETVMFRNGYLTEASASNVLIVRDGRIIAPPKDNLILPGITYDATLEIAKAIGVPLDVRAVTRAEALGADEMWLSSSSKEVLAITRVDGQAFAGGAPGPVFRRVWEAFQARKR